MEECVFCKIRDGEIPAKIMYQDDDIMVFPDVHPVKPVHLLFVPKKHIKEFTAIEDMTLLAKIGEIVQQMVGKNDLQNRGYRITINGGGAQEVHHLHIHLTGPMGSNIKM